MTTTIPWLSLAIFVPILAGIIVLICGSDSRPKYTRIMSLVGAIISFLMVLPVLCGFDGSTAQLQFVEQHSWIQAINVEFHLAIDGISYWLVFLTAFITIMVVLAGWKVITKRIAQYMAAFLIMSGLVIGVFCAMDGLLFYVFFEATLIPMYIIIGVWGGPNRVYAAIKFFLYTLLGSLLTLIAFVYLYSQSGSFSIAAWQALPLSMTEQILIFFALFAAFAVKIPMWPVHTWLPDAHVEAPTGGSIVLAAVMLKLGAYGFLRFSLPIAPDASRELAWFMIALALVAIIYISFVAIVQKDMKKLVAYSSIAHMGFVTLGIFLLSDGGLEGAIVQMVSHGFVSGAMFMCIGVLYDRLHTREIADYGGVINVMPRFVAFFVFFSMANSGLPATSGFVGEFYVIMAAVADNFWIALGAATSLILGASYSLWMVRRVAYGKIHNEAVRQMPDVSCREFFILALFAALVVYMGVYPQFFTDSMHASVQHLLEHVAQSKL
ncbi:NADH-quinone oxidoreductase subunit M [Brackiella oedipodis]|uniref:NADH-quinone oxidoreductase subunit M n=1 Tax=Brackiella oedipodis TaxID=124225 RepID=UPI00048A6EBA|nr:NADH-quinone oxidoreductase subunit M [Brackiella oedipodis]